MVWLLCSTKRNGFRIKLFQFVEKQWYHYGYIWKIELGWWHVGHIREQTSNVIYITQYHFEHCTPWCRFVLTFFVCMTYTVCSLHHYHDHKLFCHLLLYVYMYEFHLHRRKLNDLWKNKIQIWLCMIYNSMGETNADVSNTSNVKRISFWTLLVNVNAICFAPEKSEPS